MKFTKKKFHHSGKKRKRTRILTLLGLFILFLLFFVVLPLKNINSKGRDVVAKAKAVKYAVSQNDMDLVKTSMNDMQVSFDSFHKEAGKIYWMRFIPIAGWYVSDFRSGVEAGDHLLKAGNKVVDTLTPYADLIGFKKGTAGFSDKSADDRLQTAVLTLDKAERK